MPIYEYRCESCGEEQEVLQKISEPALADCPACGEPALKKLVSAAGFQLKGTGWYVTDFRDKGKSAGKKDDKESGDKPAGDKTEAPSATKAETKEPIKAETTSAGKSGKSATRKGGEGATAGA